MTTDTEILATPAELAEILRIGEKQVYELRRKHKWPCVRLSPKTIRFTADQVAAIVEKHSETPAPAPVAAAPTIEGQTTRSRRRRSA